MPNPFATAVIAGIYASRSKKDIKQRYSFKRDLVIQILDNFNTGEEESAFYLTALFHFVDNLLQLPSDLKNKLREDMNPYLGKEVINKMRAEKSELPPTLAELFAEFEQDGIEKGIKTGKEEATKNVAIALIRDDFSNDRIVKLTKLSLDEVVALRKSLQN